MTVVGVLCATWMAAVFTRSPAPRTAERIGQIVELVYSRVDADGSLREARVAREA